MEHPLRSYRRIRGLNLDQLAGDLGIQAPALSKWERKRIPAERVLDVERVTGISRHELRPDLYPSEPEQVRA